jgi:hypothetical protein
MVLLISECPSDIVWANKTLGFMRDYYTLFLLQCAAPNSYSALFHCACTFHALIVVNLHTKKVEWCELFARHNLAVSFDACKL